MRRLLAFRAVLLFAAVCAAAAADDRIFIPAKINGQPVKLAFDTGAQHHTLFRRTTDRLGLKVTPPPADYTPPAGLVAGGIVEPCRLEIGGSSAQVRFRSLEIPAFLRFGADGVLSWRGLTDAIIAIRWDRKEAGPLAAVPGPARRWLKRPLRPKDWMLGFTLAGDGGAEHVVYIDTGSPFGAALSARRWEQWLAAHPDRPATLEAAYFPADGLVVSEVRLADRLAFGPLVLRDVPIRRVQPSLERVFPKLEGVLGLFALTRLDVILDGKNQCIYLHANPDAKAACNYNRLGAVFTPRDLQSADLLARVIDATPAHRAGIRNGDVLLRIDGLDATKWRTDPRVLPLARFWSRRAGTRLTLTLSREGQRYETAVELEDILAPARAHNARLLTDNGLANEEFSQYKDAAFLRTDGRYVANPAFSKETAAAQPFASGRLTNGDASFNYKRKPNPYSYWQGVKRAEVSFDLSKPYRIRRVRVCVLCSGPHGTARIELFRRGDPLEFPEALKLGEMAAKNGWNDLKAVDALADGLRLRFTRAKGKSYITVSEVEIWGSQAPEGTVPTSPRKLSGKSIREGDVEWYAFDFGPKASPTFANFTGVSKDVAYTKERGYGWLPYKNGRPATPSNFGPESERVPGLGERDRARKKGAAGDSLYRDFVTTAEYYHTQVRQTFVLDVPNGRCRVITFHGDMSYGRQGEQCWWIEAEGKRVVEKLVFPATLRADAVFDVEVADGQLTLTFDAAHSDPARRGFALNGLAIFPAATKAQADFANAKIARIRAAVEREHKEHFEAIFTEKPYAEEAEMPPVSAADKARGYVPFVPHWLANVYPNSVPRPADLKRPLGCFACPGEYEPMAVALRSLTALKAASCTVSDLTGPGRIPAAAVEVRTVKCWPQRLGSSWSTEWRVMPELLEARKSVDVAANTTQEFWLTIRVPEDAKPGLYKGTATLRADDAGEATFPMTVEVLPFKLRPNERPVGMYWYEHKVAGTPLRDAQVRDMLAHGMTTLTMGRLFPEVRNDDGKLVLDVAELRQFLQELERLGVEGPIPYHTSGLMTKLRRAFPGKTQAELDALYVEATRQLEAVSSRPDTPKLLYYPVDEIGNSPKRGEKARHECALVAKAPGATSYITVNNYGASEKWGETFDIWCGNIEYTADQEAKLLTRGKRYMRYGSAYLNNARKARNSCGLGFYRRPAEAMFYWHYQATNGDPFNDFDGTARDWCAAYPGPDGALIPTIDWESLREGVDDMRYIATLKHYAALVAKTPQGKPIAARALKTLAEVLGGDDRVNQYTFRDDLSDDAYHALRRRLADAIVELLQVVPAQDRGR